MNKILWTVATWNPFTGCSKISEGCVNCYAEKKCLRNKAIEEKANEKEDKSNEAK